jgi:pyrroline-5-carboxylate reductase
MRISFIGFGNMAKALAEGLIKQGQTDLWAASPSLSQGINAEGIHTCSDNKLVIQGASLLILAVKPSTMQSVLEEIAPTLAKDCLVISVATGLPLAFFNRYLDSKQPVVRTMPNTGASVGEAATPLIANTHTTAKQRQWAEQVFQSVGLTTWIEDESLMDVYTAFSGSGPAYVFLFIEAFTKAAVALGIDEPIAKLFAKQTVNGALQLALKSPLNIETLRNKVTSPGGTTAAALAILHPKLETLMLDAMKAALARAKELGGPPHEIA